MEPTIYLFFKGNRLEALMTMKKIDIAALEAAVVQKD
jgi:hypothetical protein